MERVPKVTANLRLSTMSSRSGKADGGPCTHCPCTLDAVAWGVQVRVRGLRGFEWDAGNWRKSELKHGVAMAEAQEVLLRGTTLVRLLHHSA